MGLQFSRLRDERLRNDARADRLAAHQQDGGIVALHMDLGDWRRVGGDHVGKLARRLAGGSVRPRPFAGVDVPAGKCFVRECAVARSDHRAARSPGVCQLADVDSDRRRLNLFVALTGARDDLAVGREHGVVAQLEDRFDRGERLCVGRVRFDHRDVSDRLLFDRRVRDENDHRADGGNFGAAGGDRGRFEEGLPRGRRLRLAAIARLDGPRRDEYSADPCLGGNGGRFDLREIV